jgi:UDP-2,3-diacylglucosamine hydrolase
MTTLFISDLHLTDARPTVTELFLKFLRTDARTAEALYILGDFFEYWVGDDAIEQTEFRPIVAGLRSLTQSGVPVYLMHGNRDFLMGERFEAESGCRIIPDPTRIDLYGTPVLLLHGDALCTDDVEYQQFRKIVRSELWLREFLAKPLAERDAIARNYREKSRVSTSQKAPEIMDVTQDAVRQALREHAVLHMIHGHTHRPNKHTFDVDGKTAQRIVLGDWYEQGSVLRCTKNAWELLTLPVLRDIRATH